MRIVAPLLLVLLFTLSMLTAAGCQRAPAETSVHSLASHSEGVAVRSAPLRRFTRMATAPRLLFCECARAESREAGASAIAAQVAADMEPNNDDPNDLIAMEFADRVVAASPRDLVEARMPSRAEGWARAPLRPPRRPTA